MTITQDRLNSKGEVVTKVVKRGVILPTIVLLDDIRKITPAFGKSGNVLKRRSIVTVLNEDILCVGNYIKLSESTINTTTRNVIGFKLNGS